MLLMGHAAQLIGYFINWGLMGFLVVQVGEFAPTPPRAVPFIAHTL